MSIETSFMISQTRVPTRMTTRMMLQIQSQLTSWNTTCNSIQELTEISTTSYLPFLNLMRTELILLFMEVMPTRTMLMRINTRKIPQQKLAPQISLENTQSNLKLILPLFLKTGETLLSTSRSTERHFTRKLLSTQMKTITRMMLQLKQTPLKS
jgi:hypothetical protein